MNSNLNIKRSLVLVMILSGCASSGSKTKVVAQSSTPALPASAYMSTRDAAMPERESCPANDRSWRKESLVNLSNYANNCAQLGKFERVEQIGNFISQNQHRLPWGPYYLSLASEGNKQYARALWMIELAINKSPRTAMLYYQRGRVHWHLGNYAKSVESYNVAIKENPKFLDAHLFLAELYFRDQNFKLAESHFSAATEIAPNQTAAVAGLAETRSLLGNANSAIELYERAVSMSPRSLVFRFKLAALYEDVQKDYAQALTAYKRIKTIIVESRSPANEQPVDVNKKILRLETILSEAKAPEKKLSDSEQNNKRVRK